MGQVFDPRPEYSIEVRPEKAAVPTKTGGPGEGNRDPFTIRSKGDSTLSRRSTDIERLYRIHEKLGESAEQFAVPQGQALRSWACLGLHENGKVSTHCLPGSSPPFQPRAKCVDVVPAGLARQPASWRAPPAAAPPTTEPHPASIGAIDPKPRRSTRWCATISGPCLAPSTTGRLRYASPAMPGSNFSRTAIAGFCAAPLPD